jgi:hypothetical protein
MAQPVHAAVILSVGGHVVTDNGAGDVDPLHHQIVNVADPVGAGRSINTGTTAALPSIDLSSVEITGRAPATLVVKFTETDLTSSGPKLWRTVFSGSWAGGAASVELQTYLDANNKAFGTGTLLSDLKGTSSLFALNGEATAGGGLFSVTEVLTITALAAGEHFSLDGLVFDAPVPEPASIGLLGASLMALGLCRRRPRPA